MPKTLDKRHTTEHALSDAPCVVIILTAGLAANGLLLLTNYIIWDGWWLTQELVYGKRFDLLLRHVLEFGRPLDYLYWRFLGCFPAPEFAAKVFAVLAWILASLCMYAAFVGLAKLDRLTACAIAALFVVFPGYDMFGESILFMNTTSVAIFWTGWWLISRWQHQLNWWRRCLLLLIFVVSFNLNSLLVFFYATAGVFIVLRGRCSPLVDVGRSAWRYGIRIPELAVLPWAYWVAKGLLFPTSGFHQEYNVPKFEIKALWDGYVHMWQHLVLFEISQIAEFPSVLLLALLVALIAYRYWFADAGDTRVETRCAVLMVILGAIWLASAGFPYIAVGQNLAGEGWLSRNSILAGAPVGMLLVGLCMLVNRTAFPRHGRLWAIGVLMIVLLMTAACISRTLILVAFGAKQESIRIKIRQEVEASNSVLVQLRDYFPLEHSIPYYPPLIWSYLVGRGEGNPRCFVMDVGGFAPPEEVTNADGTRGWRFPAVGVDREVFEQLIVGTLQPWLLDGVPRSGPQQMFIVMPGREGTNGAQIGARYLRLQLFQPEKVPDYLAGLTETATLQLPPIQSR